MSSRYEKLIEAARAVLVSRIKWTTTCGCTCQHCLALDYDIKKLRHQFDALAALPPASPAPEPAKGVRCWRRAGGFLGTNPISTDRLRERPDGTLEWVRRDGSVLPSHDKIEDYASNLANGSWVECPDAPYVAPVVKDFRTTAPPVAAPAPAMPEDTVPGVADCESRKHKTCGCVLCTCEDEDQCQGCGAKYCDTHRPRPTTTAPRESAETMPDADGLAWSVVASVGHPASVDNNGYFRATFARAICARDATWQAEVDAERQFGKSIASKADAEIERLTRENEKQRADLVTHYQGAIDTHYKPRIAALESRLAEREAGGGEDKELLETARRLMPSLVTANPQACPGEVAGDCVNYAKLLHAALSERGQG